MDAIERIICLIEAGSESIRNITQILLNTPEGNPFCILSSKIVDDWVTKPLGVRIVRPEIRMKRFCPFRFGGIRESGQEFMMTINTMTDLRNAKEFYLCFERFATQEVEIEDLTIIYEICDIKQTKEVKVVERKCNAIRPTKGQNYDEFVKNFARMSATFLNYFINVAVKKMASG